MEEFKYIVLERYGKLSDDKPIANTPNKTIAKEFQLIQWGTDTPKFDIRTWSNTGTCYKGITLTFDECRNLREILNDIDIDRVERVFSIKKCK